MVLIFILEDPAHVRELGYHEHESSVMSMSNTYSHEFVYSLANTGLISSDSPPPPGVSLLRLLSTPMQSTSRAERVGIAHHR